MKKIIDEEKIFSLIEETKSCTGTEVRNIINKSLKKDGLTLKEVAALLNVKDKSLIEEIKSAAKKVKEDIYGKRIVIFAPLYVTNECVNDCLYCGFRRSNDELERKTLSLDELRTETRLLTEMGHKRILLVFGEHPKYANADFVTEAVNTVYSAGNGKNEIRRINVNVAPMEVKDFRKIKASGIGTYQEFQETYHRETYEKMHPVGPKSDYEYRITAFERAFEAGIDDLGAGVLFGLFDHKFETLAMISHCEYLEKTIGVGPHTISVPRLEPALNAPAANTVPYPISDEEFMKLVSIIRLAVPYTGMILTTRETTELRAELIHFGISQMSAGSKTDPGGYGAADKDLPTKQQFALGDFRTLDEVIYDLSKSGFIPSFCTGCYRLGRTGIDFMAITKPGLIQRYCQPNALSTFKEYLIDYASPETREVGEALIRKELDNFKDVKGKEQTLNMIKKLENGERDVFC